MRVEIEKYKEVGILMEEILSEVVDYMKHTVYGKHIFKTYRENKENLRIL